MLTPAAPADNVSFDVLWDYQQRIEPSGDWLKDENFYWPSPSMESGQQVVLFSFSRDSIYLRQNGRRKTILCWVQYFVNQNPDDCTIDVDPISVEGDVRREASAVAGAHLILRFLTCSYLFFSHPVLFSSKVNIYIQPFQQQQIT